MTNYSATATATATETSRPGLSSREAEIMALIAAGHTNARIADHLFVTEKTIKNYVNKIYAKLGAASRSDAVSRWQGGSAR